MIIELNKDNFESEVLTSNKPVVIDFWATWCMPCKMMSPIIDEIAEENDNIKVCKVNVDEQPELASTFKISGIPTIVCLKDGMVVNQSVGVRPKEDIEKMIFGR